MTKEELMKCKDNLSKLKGSITGYPSIDKPWTKYYTEEQINEELPKKSIYQFALDNINELGKMDDVAIDIRTSFNDFEKINTISYRELFQMIDNWAKSLKTMDSKKDEIIPIIIPNVMERYMLYSTSALGSISYPISPLLPVNQLEKILNDNDIKKVFIFDMLYDKYKSAFDKSSSLKDIIVTGNNIPLGDKRIIPMSEFNGYSKDIKGKICPFYEANHVSSIIGTSGTTGTSKGVCLTDDNINYAAASHKNSDYEGTMMDALIPSIGYGIAMLHFETAYGKYVYLIPELLTKKFPEALCKIKPDNYPGGPVHAINLANSPEFKSGKVPKIKNMISGGASLAVSVEETLNKVKEGYKEESINEDVILRQGYGLTEDTAVCSYNKRGAYAFGSVGIPSVFNNVGIFEPGTEKPLKYNEVGEICITGPMVMKEYLNNKKETDEIIKVHSDGKRWIHTKDIGYIDEDGHIYHVDRIKNIFMRTGFNVHPSKIAEFIDGLPHVRNSAVIGFEHPDEQMVPIAFVEKNDDTPFEEIKEELKSECYKELEETSVPYDYIEVDEIPLNAGGKIDVNLIKQKANIDLNTNSNCPKKLVFKNN